MGSLVHGHMGSNIHGFMGSWVHGFTDSWVNGFLGSWVNVYMGSRVHGFVAHGSGDHGSGTHESVTQNACSTPPPEKYVWMHGVWYMVYVHAWCTVHGVAHARRDACPRRVAHVEKNTCVVFVWVSWHSHCFF